MVRGLGTRDSPRWRFPGTSRFFVCGRRLRNAFSAQLHSRGIIGAPRSAVKPFQAALRGGSLGTKRGFKDPGSQQSCLTFPRYRSRLGRFFVEPRIPFRYDIRSRLRMASAETVAGGRPGRKETVRAGMGERATESASPRDLPFHWFEGDLLAALGHRVPIV